MTTTLVLRGVAATCTVALLASACTGNDAESEPSGQTDARASAYAETECSREITVAVIGSATCGILTVPENRDQGTGEVQLQVSRLVPPDMANETPVLVVGLDAALNYSGIAPLAQRVSSPVLFLEPRGVASSVPSLACEPTAPPVTWLDQTGSAPWRQKIATWVRDCRESLTDRGIDVTAYGVDDMTADAVDLLDALGLDQVSVMTYGSSGRVALELMRDHPQRLRAVVLDTPDLPGVDHRTYAATTALDALQQVLAWCDRDADCRGRYPDPTTLLERALRAVEVRPWTLRVSLPSGPEPVLLDAAMLVRIARQTTTDGGSLGPWGQPTALPRLLQAVVDGDVRQPATALSQMLGYQGPLCPGYRPKCSPGNTVSEGVAATVLCGDVADPGAARRTPADLPDGFEETWGAAAWWWETCDVWPVEPEPTEQVTAEVPTLVLIGGLGAIPPEVIRDELAGLANLSEITVPTGAHNVVGDDCVLEIRDRWLQDPQPVSTPTCIEKRLEW